MINLLKFFAKPPKQTEQLSPNTQITPSNILNVSTNIQTPFIYNPFNISTNFPNGFSFEDSKHKYNLERNGNLVCYRFGLDADDEESEEQTWIQTEKENLKDGTIVEGIGVLPDKDIATIVDSYIAESLSEDTPRILKHREEAKKIIRRAVISPLENTSYPLVILYNEQSAKTTMNGSIGLYFPNWQLTSSTP